MTFKDTYHKHIITILNSLKSDFFLEISAFFGGGTLLTLLYNEYRLSKDIDFICPVDNGYRMLRSEIFDKQYQAIFKDITNIEFPREIRADQYGVRFVIKIGLLSFKFEIIAEARIKLQPAAFYSWADIPCLSFTDACAEKLLSNSDRWADTSAKSRDLIDLSMLRLQSKIPDHAIEKSESAYPVIKPLEKAIKFFMSNQDYRNDCFTSLQVKKPALIMNGIRKLASDLYIS